MSNDDQLDEQLRRLARRSIERRASAVDTDAAFVDHLGHLDSSRSPTPGSRRWLAGAAAAAVVVAGVAALAWPRSGTDPVRVATETVAPPPVLTDSATTTEPLPATTASVRTEPPGAQSLPTSSVPDGVVRQYGSADDGFTVTGRPVGLAETEVPLSEFIGPTGDLVVVKRFTGEKLDSQINITRSSRVDVSALVAEFETAAAEGAAETTRVFVGEDSKPGFLYRDALSGWLGVMWPVSETSVFYVLAQGLSEDEILAVAGSVGVVR